MELKIDLSYLEEMTAGDNNLKKEMIEIFKEQVPEFISEMTTAVKNNDCKALAAVAHRAKSSVAIMGIISLTEDLNVLENIAANNEHSDEYPEFIKRFISITNQAIIYLTDFSLKF